MGDINDPEERLKLDEIDLALLDALRNDASLQLEKLARLVRLSPSSVHDRLRKLERDKVIIRWTLDIDDSAIGLNVLAYVGVRTSKSCSVLIPTIAKHPEVEECHSVAGDLSLLLKIRVVSTAALLALIDRLRQIPGIEETETTIVLKTHLDRPISAAAAESGVSSRSKQKR